MITTCTECRAKYQLDAEKVPPRVIRVRCPACKSVFEIDGTTATAPAATVPAATAPAATAPPAAPETVAVGGLESFSAPRPPTREVAAKAPERAPAAETPATTPAATIEKPVPQAGVAVMDEPAPAPARRRRSKEEMLARALVSDIKVYNREMYETALAEDNLLEALGPEIKKSWELYKEKVTPEVANSTDHFRDALNDILAEGKKIF